MSKTILGSVRLALTGAFAFAITVAQGAVCRIGETEYDSLVTAIQESAADDVIELLSDVSEAFSDGTAKTTYAPIDHNLTITSADGVRREIYATNKKGYTFKVVNGSTLTLSNIVLRSVERSTESYDMYLYAYGKNAKVVFGEDFLMTGITNKGAHAVCYWENQAKFDMKPGAEVRHLYANYGHLRFNSSTFDFSGGIVSDCYSASGEGCPIYLINAGAHLNMTGGTVTRCTCSSATSAAVFLHSNGKSTANISGGFITNNTVLGVFSDVRDTSAAELEAFIKLSGNAVVSNNVRGDVGFRRTTALRLGGDFMGYASVTNLSTSGIPAFGTVAGVNTNWYCGASNLRLRGDDSYQMLNDNAGNLVWGPKPVRVGETYYRTLYEAMDAASATETFEILYDNPEFKNPVITTNKNWRFVGVDGQKTLTWPSKYYAFYLNKCNFTLNDAVLTAVKRVNTKPAECTGSNQHFMNFAGGSLTLENGGGLTNVATSSHAVIAMGHNGVTGNAVGEAVTSSLILKSGAVLTGLTSNYGPLRFEGAGARVVMQGGVVSGCVSRSGEGAPFCFQDAINMTMTGGTITGNSSSSATSATFWCNYNSSNPYPFVLDLLGGEISGNSNASALMIRPGVDRTAATRVTLGGSMVVGAPGFCIARYNSGGGVVLSANDDYTGTCALFTTNGLLASPAETLVLGGIPAAKLSQFTWSNAGDYPEYQFASASGLAVFAPVGATESEIIGDNSAWSLSTGFEEDLNDVLVAQTQGGVVYLFKDITATKPLGLNTASYVLNGLGHTITCASTNLLREIRVSVTLKNMTVTGNRGRNTVSGTAGRLTLGDGFVFTDFAGSYGYSYASLVAESGGTLVIEDGAVIENGLSQVGVLRVGDSGSRIVMNGGIIRNIGFDPISAYRGEGAAVNIFGGTFEMNGGVISNCVWDASAANPQFAGAVYYNSANSTFLMTGGCIVENTTGVYCGDRLRCVAGFEGTATVASNLVSDVYMTRTDVIRQTGDFSGDVVVTMPEGGVGSAFGIWTAGEGTEHFRQRRRFGSVNGGLLVWDKNAIGTVIRIQ